MTPRRLASALHPSATGHRMGRTHMADDVWILGAAMTKFGRYPDLEATHLGAQAARAALDDAGVTIRDVGVIAAGNILHPNHAGQMLQRHIGQTGAGIYNVLN